MKISNQNIFYFQIIKNLFDNFMYNHTNEDSTEDLELDNDCDEIFLE